MIRVAGGVEITMTPEEEAAFLAALPDPKITARATMEVTDLQFAVAAIQPEFGFMTAQEAADWVGAGAIPALAQAVIDALPDQTSREAATIKIRGARMIGRNEPFIAWLAAAAVLSDDDVDAFFAVAASIV